MKGAHGGNQRAEELLAVLLPPCAGRQAHLRIKPSRLRGHQLLRLGQRVLRGGEIAVVGQGAPDERIELRRAEKCPPIGRGGPPSKDLLP